MKKCGFLLFIISFVFSQQTKDIQTKGYNGNEEGKVVSKQTSSIGKVGNILTATGGFLLASTYLKTDDELTFEESEDPRENLRIRGLVSGVLIGFGQVFVFLDSSTSEGESLALKLRKALLGF